MAVASPAGPDPASVPLPAGVRIGWSELPAPVQAWVETTLGSPIRSAATQVGGFSPGVAARLVTADGSRAFLKAVGTELNPDSAGLHRRELRAMSVLPRMSHAPELIAGYDDGSWVGLLMEDIEGRQPVLPWVPAELDRTLATVTAVSERLTPSPWPDAPPVRDELADTFAHWRRLAVKPPPDLDPWLADRLDSLASWEQEAIGVTAGSSLIHLDIRADNVLLRPSGEAVLVDWAWACRAAPWLDVVLLMINVVQYGPLGPDELDAIVAAHPLTREVDPWSITLVLIGSLGYFESRSRDKPPPGLPTIRSFQRHAAAGTARWLRHRLAGSPV